MTEIVKNHALEFYRELEKRADANEFGIPVFEGQVTKVMHYLGISSRWYSPIIRLLRECEAITLIQRGTRYQPTVIVLRGEPTDEKISEKGLTTAGPPATLVARLESRIAALESWRVSTNGFNLVEAMANHELRLSQLESSIQERESNSKPMSN